MIKGQLKQATEIVKALHTAKAANPELTDKEVLKQVLAEKLNK